MTPQELDAIRARDAALGNPSVEPPQPQTFWSCAADRRALLAEVDRLTVLVDRLAMAENDMGLTAMLMERARIRAAVEGLPEMRDTDGIECVGGVDRAAVLAAIDGGEK